MRTESAEPASATRSGQTGPLAGVRVLDCSRLFPFAYTTQLLHDMGADIIKVEPPGGEPGRALRTHFAMTNGGKRSVTADLKTSEGRARFLEMVADTDVVVESFRPGVLDSLGCGYQEMAAVNSRVVLCSISAYGATGPLRDRPAHDLNVYALSGALQPSLGSPPALPAIPVVDMGVAHFAAFSIAAALLAVAKTGRGEHLDVSMSDLALSLNTSSVAFAQSNGDSGLPWPEFVTGDVPCYSIYETSDHRYVVLANFERKFWLNFLELIGRQDLGPDQYSTGERATEVRSILAGVLAEKSLQEWDQILGAAEICYAPVLTSEEALEDPHHQARGMILEEADGLLGVGSPRAFGAMRPDPRGTVPPQQT